MTREIILIGGKFHRQRVRIQDYQCEVRMPLLPEIRAMKNLKMDYLEPIKYVEYGQVASIFGECRVIPENVFIWKEMNVVDFIRNLILDYTK